MTNDDEIIYKNDGEETDENESPDANTELSRLTELLQRGQADSVNYKKRMEEVGVDKKKLNILESFFG